ncbi:MAG TPA: O-antigen ligase family protein [Noviherbaspirillum sp.]|uniref:O-antigen ligase family protein n=1 Tax=Noviherbaspirillum sp. TaxID=1926288 RepID=UPI002DDCC24B|nr:O-antigen ligase family protein [Noviherbaspirillum sp.]HEV2609937.1 O-antigen ligase family protein [Noviherbaspirillum sp.]
MNEIISMLTAGVGALIFGIVGIFAFGWLLLVQKRLRRWTIAMIFPILIAAIGIGAILSGRDFTAEASDAVKTEVGSGMLVWFFRLTTIGILGICMARLVSVSQSLENRGREGRGLFFAFVFFYVTNLVINNILGTDPVFHDRYLPAIIIFTAIYFSRGQDRNTAVDATKVGLLFFMVGSCALAVVKPNLALQTGYDMGYLPGLNIRLWGIGSNPNSLGPLAVIFLLLLTFRPFRMRWLQILAIGAGLVTLVLTQSKTAWIAALIAFFIVWWTRSISSPANPRQRNISYYSPRNFAAPMVVCLMALGLIFVYGILMAFDQEVAVIDRDLQVSSLTGRTQIWEAAIGAWQTNPLFGYGSNVWGPEFRKSIGIDAALSAHSQFMQSLSEAGLVGLLGLLIYMTALFARAYTTNAETRGMSLALFSIVFVRSISETPLDLTNIFGADFLIHLLLFRVVLVHTYAPVRVPQPQLQPQLQWSKT